MMYQGSARYQRVTIRLWEEESPQPHNRDLKTEPSSTMTKDGSFLTNVGGSEGRIKSNKKPTCNKQHHVINRNRQQRTATFGHIGEHF